MTKTTFSFSESTPPKNIISGTSYSKSAKPYSERSSSLSEGEHLPREISNRYDLIQTRDGSFSLRLRGFELMHHSAGAFSETIEIYLPALRGVFENGWPPHFVNIGLGIGYHEILLAALLEHTLVNPSDFIHSLVDSSAIEHSLVDSSNIKYSLVDSSKIDKGLALRDLLFFSFEADQDLRLQFINWISNDSNPAHSASLNWVYEDILQRCSEFFDVDSSHVKARLRDMIASNCLQFFSEISNAGPWPGKVSAILFDAFSAKTSPDLWTEDFLLKLLENLAAPQSLLATYACNGALKRSLLNKNFTLERRVGFAGKRHSTFAIRRGRE